MKIRANVGICNPLSRYRPGSGADGIAPPVVYFPIMKLSKNRFFADPCSQINTAVLLTA